MMAGNNWRNRRVRVGSGEPLRRYRWWQMFGRSLRSITLRSAAGTTSTYTVDVRHAGDMTDGEIRARLYVDGALQSYAKMPTRFAVPGGHIEVAITGFGLKLLGGQRNSSTLGIKVNNHHLNFVVHIEHSVRCINVVVGNFRNVE